MGIPMGTESNSTIDDRGRLTIPQEIRDKLQLVSGTKVSFELSDGQLIIRKAISRREFVQHFSGIISGPEEDEDLKKIWVKEAEE